jgi:L-fucose mutarotase
MLRGIHPLLTADLLHVLARMGHGDDLAILDANHPAETVAASTVTGTLIRLPGVRTDALTAAVMTLFPLDQFTDDPVRFMEVIGKPDELPVSVAAIQAELRKAGYEGQFASLERYAFYETAKTSFAAVQCGDARFYSNVILRKGAIEGKT